MQELLCERGVAVSHETIRAWGRKFGQDDANRLLRRRPQPGDKGYLDAVFLPINGKRHSLWRAVDQDDSVLSTHFCRQLVAGWQGCAAANATATWKEAMANA